MRSELLDAVKGGSNEYDKWFLPIEPDEEDLDEASEAHMYFSEVLPI